jgi:hypothetical protein
MRKKKTSVRAVDYWQRFKLDTFRIYIRSTSDWTMLVGVRVAYIASVLHVNVELKAHSEIFTERRKFCVCLL